jgi:hypothetical protein
MVEAYAELPWRDSEEPWSVQAGSGQNVYAVLGYEIGVSTTQP